ncbi:MAG: hypothetical protein WHS89_11225 [Acidimicrobiales bacterium]|jgi:hypothetical protein
MRKHPSVLVVAVAAAVFGSMSGGVAGAAPPARVTICHGTASPSNAYVVITVADRSFKDGHLDDGVEKSHGPRNNPDLVLLDGSCAPEPPPN